MRPLLLRPARLLCYSNNVFSGVVLVISEKSEPDMLRRPLVVALYVFIAT